MDEGRVIQTGVTSQVYHRPETIKVAEVFSDPPINLLDASVMDNMLDLGKDVKIPLRGHLKSLSSGNYIVGIRSNHLFLNPQNGKDISLNSTVELAEINGSETFIHANYESKKLVVQELGIYSQKIGSQIMVYLDQANLFVFSESGALILSPGN